MAKINVPGINFSNIVYPEYPHAFVCGLFVLCFSVVWRAQIAARAKATSFPTTDIPKLETCRFIASAVMNNPICSIVPATNAVFSTIIWEGDALLPTNSISEKTAIIHESAKQVLSTKGPSRVLSNNQITAETLPLHRRGLIAQSIGKIQNDPIYSTPTIVQGADIHNLDFPLFFSSFLELCQRLNISSEILRIIFAPSNFSATEGCITGSGGILENKALEEDLIAPDPKSLELAGFAYLTDFLYSAISSSGSSEAFVKVNDGLLLSYETDNLTPLEKGFPIKRSSPPAKLAMLDPQTAEADPFTRLASKQIQGYNSSLVGVPASRKRNVGKAKDSAPTEKPSVQADPKASPQPVVPPSVAPKAAPKKRTRKPK